MLLPIHAAGCYDVPGSEIFDYVISSYTPILSALLTSQQSPTKFPGFLAVGQAETSGYASPPGMIAELNVIKRQARDIGFIQLDGSQAAAAAIINMTADHS